MMIHWETVGGMGTGMELFGFGFGWIFMILFWSLLIAGGIYFFTVMSGCSKTAVGIESAGNVLRRRYASGEMSKEEFHDKMSVVLDKF